MKVPDGLEYRVQVAADWAERIAELGEVVIAEARHRASIGSPGDYPTAVALSNLSTALRDHLRFLKKDLQ